MPTNFRDGKRRGIAIGIISDGQSYEEHYFWSRNYFFKNCGLFWLRAPESQSSLTNWKMNAISAPNACLWMPCIAFHCIALSNISRNKFTLETILENIDPSIASTDSLTEWHSLAITDWLYYQVWAQIIESKTHFNVLPISQFKSRPLLGTSTAPHFSVLGLKKRG